MLRASSCQKSLLRRVFEVAHKRRLPAKCSFAFTMLSEWLCFDALSKKSNDSSTYIQCTVYVITCAVFLGEVFFVELGENRFIDASRFSSERL